MKWLARQDDDWSDGAHTALVMGLAAVFAAPCLWTGLGALASGRLAPVMGPDFGVWLFGPQALAGAAARRAGLALLVLGGVFLAWGLACTRWARPHPRVRALPWGLLLLDLGLFRWADAAA